MVLVAPHSCQILIHMCIVTWQLSDPSSGLVAGWSSARTTALITRQRVCFSAGHSRVEDSGSMWGLLRLRLRAGRGHFWCTELTKTSYRISCVRAGGGSKVRSRREASNWGRWCFLSMVYVVIWWGAVYQAHPFSFHAAELLTVIQIGTSRGGRPWAGVSKLWCHGICRGRLAGSGRWVDVIEQTQNDTEKQTWHFRV